MIFKNFFNKIFKTRSKNNKINAGESYCYTNMVWNSEDNIIILISFTEDYFEQIIDIQDAVNYTWQELSSKIVYSSYEEETDKLDENGNPIIIIHKKHYLLIGGAPLEWESLYANIHDLSNEVLSKISKEIVNNCSADYFKNLVEDGILYGFINECNYDTLKECGEYSYTDPEILLKRLPSGFTGRDLLKFIKIHRAGIESNAWEQLLDLRYTFNERFLKHQLYQLYSALIKDVTIEKLRMVIEPLYKQPDDDSIPGDVSDETLDAIFRENYERFSAIMDDSIQYEDIDEELTDDELDDVNNEEGDKV